MTTAMVLCAGYGTRLSPLTDELPKPLVPVGDRPLLTHILERLGERGVSRAVINAHHKHDLISIEIDRLPLKAHLRIEPEILGTAGGIAAARPVLGVAPVLLHNGDILVEPPVARLLAAVGDGLCLAVVLRERGAGSLGLDSAGRVVRLRGRSFASEARGADYIGVAALGARCLATLPERGCLVGDWAIPELIAGGSIPCVAIDSPYQDLGTHESYLAANLQWLGTRNSFVAPGARVEPGVELVRSVVGAGALVSGEGTIEDSVIWPGARASAPLSRSIVTSTGLRVSVPQSAG